MIGIRDMGNYMVLGVCAAALIIAAGCKTKGNVRDRVDAIRPRIENHEVIGNPKSNSKQEQIEDELDSEKDSLDPVDPKTNKVTNPRSPQEDLEQKFMEEINKLKIDFKNHMGVPEELKKYIPSQYLNHLVHASIKNAHFGSDFKYIHLETTLKGPVVHGQLVQRQTNNTVTWSSHNHRLAFHSHPMMSARLRSKIFSRMADVQAAAILGTNYLDDIATQARWYARDKNSFYKGEEERFYTMLGDIFWEHAWVGSQWKDSDRKSFYDNNNLEVSARVKITNGEAFSRKYMEINDHLIVPILALNRNLKGIPRDLYDRIASNRVKPYLGNNDELALPDNIRSEYIQKRAKLTLLAVLYQGSRQDDEILLHKHTLHSLVQFKLHQWNPLIKNSSRLETLKSKPETAIDNDYQLLVEDMFSKGMLEYYSSISATYEVEGKNYPVTDTFHAWMKAAQDDSVGVRSMFRFVTEKYFGSDTATMIFEDTIKKTTLEPIIDNAVPQSLYIPDPIIRLAS